VPYFSDTTQQLGWPGGPGVLVCSLRL